MKWCRGLLILVMAISVAGCAKKKLALPDDGSNGRPPGALPGPPPPGPPGTEFGAGSEVELNIVSSSRLAEFAQHPVNNPTNIKIHANLDHFGKGRYGGYITIAYTDNGVRQAPRFGSGGSAYSAGSIDDVEYNIWFTDNQGDDVWHGFFADEWGAIVFVVDEVIDLGDGGGAVDQVSGSVWFKNFEFSNAPFPPTRCWFFPDGPYTCMTFKRGDKVRTTSSVEPNNGGYKKLGEFESMSKSDAFNE